MGGRSSLCAGDPGHGLPRLRVLSEHRVAQGINHEAASKHARVATEDPCSVGLRKGGAAVLSERAWPNRGVASRVALCRDGDGARQLVRTRRNDLLWVTKESRSVGSKEAAPASPNALVLAVSASSVIRLAQLTQPRDGRDWGGGCSAGVDAIGIYIGLAVGGLVDAAKAQSAPQDEAESGLDFEAPKILRRDGWRLICVRARLSAGWRAAALRARNRAVKVLGEAYVTACLVDNPSAGDGANCECDVVDRYNLSQSGSERGVQGHFTGVGKRAHEVGSLPRACTALTIGTGDEESHAAPGWSQSAFEPYSGASAGGQQSR
eukprot:scaffold222635_cov31-Tisochrysis_lutea.AAC.4